MDGRQIESGVPVQWIVFAWMLGFFQIPLVGF